MTSNKAPACEQRDEMDNNACDHTPCQPQVVALPPPDGGSGTKASRKARNRRGKSDMTELKLYCVPDCKKGRVQSDNMVQCHTCQTWAHYECIDEGEDDIVGIWTCNTCRKMPTMVMQLIDMVAKLRDSMSEMRNANVQLVGILAEQQSELHRLREDFKERLPVSKAFLSQVDSFVNHCDTNYLELNVSKTKEMVIDFRQARSDPQPVDIKGSAVARVETYKYLGIVLNNKLSWGDHVDLIVKKLNSRMYCLRKLNSFHITPEILNVFYTSTIVSVWRYCLVCWGGNVSKREKRRIDSIVRKAERVIGASQPSVDSVYLDLVGGKLEMVWSDTSHPLYGQLRSQLIPRGSGRLGLPYAGTNRHPASFIPKAIKMFNDNVGR